MNNKAVTIVYLAQLFKASFFRGGYIIVIECVFVLMLYNPFNNFSVVSGLQKSSENEICLSHQQHICLHYLTNVIRRANSVVPDQTVPTGAV